MAARTLPTPSISVDEFSWDKKSRTFTAEASDISWLRYGQAYDDAADRGFTLVNPKTGKECRLVEAHEQKNSDGDILFWEFVPADLGERKRLGFSVKVFND